MWLDVVEAIWLAILFACGGRITWTACAKVSRLSIKALVWSFAMYTCKRCELIDNKLHCNERRTFVCPYFESFVWHGAC